MNPGPQMLDVLKTLWCCLVSILLALTIYKFRALQKDTLLSTVGSWLDPSHVCWAWLRHWGATCTCARGSKQSEPECNLPAVTSLPHIMGDPELPTKGGQGHAGTKPACAQNFWELRRTNFSGLNWGLSQAKLCRDPAVALEAARQPPSSANPSLCKN